MVLEHMLLERVVRERGGAEAQALQFELFQEKCTVKQICEDHTIFYVS